jgi:hypothetical protein
MSMPNRNDSPALKALMRHPQIRAVVWISPRGKVKAKRGQAFSLRIGADDPTVQLPIDASADGPPEAVYVTSFGEGDFLVVIFEDQADFETIKEDVDATLEAVAP